MKSSSDPYTMIPSFFYEDAFVSSLWVIFVILVIIFIFIFYIGCFIWVSRGNLDLPTNAPRKKYAVLKSPQERVIEDDEIFTIERFSPLPVVKMVKM